MNTPQLFEDTLDRLLERLEKSRVWSPRVISKLETLIRTGEDGDLFRINPVRYAADKNMSENEAIDLFLHATIAGLVEMHWHLVCPICGHIVDSLRDLSAIHAHAQCPYCQLVTTLSLDDFIIVTFTIASAVRAIRFHMPQSLPVEELYYRVLFYQDVKASHGMAHQDILRFITRLLAQVPPGATTALELDPGGLLLAKDLFDRQGALTFVHGEETADAVHVRVQRTATRLHAEPLSTAPLEADYGMAFFQYAAMGQLPRGKIKIELENQTATPAALCGAISAGLYAGIS